MRQTRPMRIVEIGSGNSTAVMRQAILDGNLETRILSIDPAPRKDIVSLTDELRLQKVEEIPAAEIASELKSGDILFIDSSHEVALGNDCVYEFLELLPRIAPGVVIYIHDVSLPWDYPLAWVQKEPGVATWSEQYLLQALLSGNKTFEVIWPGYYAQQTSGTEFADWFPRSNGRDATSFWMVRR